ncbi:MAG: hypothetical protein D6736_09355 [Nitrospinota bacterium]|nr:MAG: hypothetical protein D6736_09355 [Nitrospinota bacterium]
MGGIMRTIKGKITKAEKVSEGLSFDLRWGGKVYKKVKTKDLWRQIIENAHASAEPGLIFWDTMKEYHNVEYANPLSSTNPCVTGDTLVATPYGYKKASDFRVGDRITTVAGTGRVARIEVNHDMPVYEVTLSDGGKIRATAGHQFHVIRRGQGQKGSKRYELVRLDQLQIGDWIRVAPTSLPQQKLSVEMYGLSERDYGFLLGVLFGDGCITEKQLQHRHIKIASTQDDLAWNQCLEKLLSFVGYCGTKEKSHHSKTITFHVQGKTPLLAIIEELGIAGYPSTKRIPEVLLQSNRRVLAGFLDGLFSTDGNVNLSSNHPTLRLSSCNPELLSDVRNILLMFGIHCNCSGGQERRAYFLAGRRIKGNPKYELIISGQSVKTFYEAIGLTHPYKKERLFRAVRDYGLTGNTWKARVLSIREAGRETVYDLFEPETDTWITNGYVSRGCGEQPLAAYTACNLGSINLTKFVREDGSVDYDALEETTRIATRFMDDVIDYNMDNHALDKIKKAVASDRRVGLGITGLGDALVLMRIGYDSEEALAEVEKIMRTICYTAYHTSVDLAREKGPFPLFDWEGIRRSKFIQNLPPELQERIRKYGLRNSTVITVPPVGTGSIVAETSSGIEPIFCTSYTRRVKNPDGETFTEYKVYHPLIKYLFGNDDNLPPYVRTAHQIDPYFRVKMQGVIQRYTDSAISSTINLPQDISVETVADIYINAYREGLKGVTVYREGSREGILQTEQAAQAREKMGAYIRRPRKRPAITYGVTERIRTGEGNLYITINEDNFGLCEVFTTIGKAGGNAAAQSEAISRLISLALRSGIDPQEIIKHLKGISGPTPVWENGELILATPDAIGKALERYLRRKEEGLDRQQELSFAVPPRQQERKREAGRRNPEIPSTETRTTFTCPECGGTAVHETGCMTCYNCGWTRC